MLNEKLRPIAETPVYVNDPNWVEQMRQSKPLEDPRDLMLSLRAIYQAARAGAVDIQPIVSEIAVLSEASLADMLRRMS